MEEATEVAPAEGLQASGVRPPPVRSFSLWKIAQLATKVNPTRVLAAAADLGNEGRIVALARGLYTIS